MQERAKLKTSGSRSVCILFPELQKIVPHLHMASVYVLLPEFLPTHAVALAHLTRLTNLLYKSSKSRHGKDTAVIFRKAVRNSIASNTHAKSLFLKYTIKLIQELYSEIESETKAIMDEFNSPIRSIPSISYKMGAMMIAKIGDLSRFDFPNKILAYTRTSPSTFQSRQLDNCLGFSLSLIYPL